jgi:hypothetical protein
MVYVRVMDIQYKLVSVPFRSDFELEISEALNDGWELYGNLTTAFVPNYFPMEQGAKKKDQLVYTQALIKMAGIN